MPAWSRPYFFRGTRALVGAGRPGRVPSFSPGARAFVGAVRLGRASSFPSVGARAFGGVCASLAEFLPPPRDQGSRWHRPTWSRPLASLGARAFVGTARLGRASPLPSVGARAFGGVCAGLVELLPPPGDQGSRWRCPTWSRPLASRWARALVGTARLGRASPSFVRRSQGLRRRRCRLGRAPTRGRVPGKPRSLGERCLACGAVSLARVPRGGPKTRRVRPPLGHAEQATREGKKRGDDWPAGSDVLGLFRPGPVLGRSAT